VRGPGPKGTPRRAFSRLIAARSVGDLSMLLIWLDYGPCGVRASVRIFWMWLKRKGKDGQKKMALYTGQSAESHPRQAIFFFFRRIC
jgi:hypothetical protein